MKISVITVCYNAAQTIAYTLNSFFEQEHADKELVVIDGGSTDATVAVVQPFVDREGVVLVSERDRGLYDAINKGLEIFTGDAVGMLNADDRFHDASILGRIANGLSETDMVSGHINYVDDHRTGRIVRRWRGKLRPRSGFKSGWMPAHPTFYVRRQVIECVGAFSLELPTSADYDWMLRACELHDFRTGFIDHVMVDMMIGGLSTSSFLSRLSHNTEALRSRQKWLGSGLVDYALFAKPLRKIVQFAQPGLLRPGAHVNSVGSQGKR